MILAKVVLRAQDSGDVGALHKRYRFLKSITEGIFPEAMVLPERTIPRFLFCKHHVLNLFVLHTPPVAPPIAQLPLSSKFLIFFLPSVLHSCPLPPSHFW
jgi:hypothetical protein